MSSEEYCERYFENRTIDLKRELTIEEIKIIEKLEAKIENKLYNGYEYEDLKEAAGIYFSRWDENKELKYMKPLKYGVTKSEYNQICNKFEKIDAKYEELLQINMKKRNFECIWFREKQHIRDKFITFLEEQTLNNAQKEKIFEIIMNMENATLMQKERFILYYGLDKNKEKIHNASKISKLENCCQSNIRQAINKIKSKIPQLSDEKIELIRKLIREK